MHALPSVAAARRCLLWPLLGVALLAAAVGFPPPVVAADPPAAKAAADAPPAERVPAPKPSAAAGTSKSDKSDKSDKPTAADGRCDRCGSCRCVVKVCVPRCTEKEITKTAWETECEDFCVPGMSRRCPDPCTKHGCPCRRGGAWEPGCGSVRSREVLVKKTKKESKPTVEWKVEERCGACRGDDRCTAAGCTAPPGSAAGPSAAVTLGGAIARICPFPVPWAAAGSATAGGTAR